MEGDSTDITDNSGAGSYFQQTMLEQLESKGFTRASIPAEVKPENLFVTSHGLAYGDFGDSELIMTTSTDPAGQIDEGEEKRDLWQLMSETNNKLEAAGFGFTIGSVAALMVLESPTSAFVGGMIGMVIALGLAILWVALRQA